MKISGFTFVKNADKLYYPIKPSILSILPIVDEYIIALGDCDSDDKTREIIKSINSDKIKIIDTIWDLQKYPHGTEHAHQTNIAKKACSGDWLFYLQADEVIHEDYLPVIKNRCQELLHDRKVEGLLFKYLHFWGDYYHYHNSHSWYKKEIRIIRNDPDIHSWESAQSFRRIPNFDEINFRQQHDTNKLKVASVDAYVFHYGWVRPPHLMENKIRTFFTIHRDKQKAEEIMRKRRFFDYGPLNRLKKYKGSHPKVMQEWIKGFNWQDKLQYSGKPNKLRRKHKHERFKYRLLTVIENLLPGNPKIGEFKNYILLKK